LFLAQFLFTEGRQDTALQYLNELRKEYPDNTLFLVLYASWQNRLHNQSEALTAARTAVEMNNKRNVRYGEDLAYNTLASSYFAFNDFQNAKTYYLLYLPTARNTEWTPNMTYFRAGTACEIAGDRVAAVEFYSRMKDISDKDRPGDTYYYRQGQELINHPLTEADILNIKGGNLVSQKLYDSSIVLYRDAFGKAHGNVDIQSRALYGVLQAQFESERLQEAMQTSQRLLALNPPAEKWIIPHTWFKLAQIYTKLGKIPEARNALDKAGEFDDYDFQVHLKSQLEEEIKKLNASK